LKQSVDVEDINSEIKALEMLRGAEHVIQIQRTFFVSRIQKIIIMEHFNGLTLSQKLERKQIGQKELISIFRQMLLGLVEIKGTIHGDIKPDNILWNEAQQKLKLIDFGLAQRSDAEKKHDVIQTAFYRCPDVILGKDYDESVDLWSVGCLIYELCTNQPLFEAFDNDDREFENLQLLSEFMAILGKPPLSYLSDCNELVVSNYFDFKYGFPNKLKTSVQPNDNPYQDIYDTYPEEFAKLVIDLIQKMVCYEDRITPEEALKHPLFK
jgi:serine/threonine protein kinase